jgi:hypothetical protein
MMQMNRNVTVFMTVKGVDSVGGKGPAADRNRHRRREK